ncbi:MAG: hypothetical protein IJF43_05590 [Firmicutes bacterium]|nr:hypothetical protein [Bacillota bacterium]
MAHYCFRQRNADAERKLQKILREPERSKKEKQFAQEHQNDTDDQLVEYVKQVKRNEGNKFKRGNLIGYCYLVERFGNWQNLCTIVNRQLDEEKQM